MKYAVISQNTRIQYDNGLLKNNGLLQNFNFSMKRNNRIYGGQLSKFMIITVLIYEVELLSLKWPGFFMFSFVSCLMLILVSTMAVDLIISSGFAGYRNC